MITLDTNLFYFQDLYNLKYGNSSAYSYVDKYTNAYAAQTVPDANSAQSTQDTQSTQNVQNTQNTDSTNKVSNAPMDYETLIETLKLEDPRNKYEIFKLLPYTELVKFLYLLEKDKLVNGLQLFTKDKLLELAYHLPKEFLLKMLFKMFTSKDQILETFSIKELNKFLSSDKIDKANVLKIFQSMNKVELAQIAETITGNPQGNKSHEQLLSFFNGLQQPKIMEGIKGLEYKKMREITSEMLKQDGELYKVFSQEALFKPLVNCQKTSIVQGMSVVDNDMLIKMLEQLPENYIALVATQINTEDFAKILVNNYQDLLTQAMAA